MIRLGELLKTHGPRLLGRQYYRWSLAFQLRGKRGMSPILVFQMGKVGSRTVTDALRKITPETAVIHAHVLSPEGIRDGEVMHRAWSKSRQEWWRNEYLRRTIEKGNSRRRWQVISLVRDPIARNVSAFFQNLDMWQTKDRHGGIPADISELQQLFLDRFDHDRPLVWFDREIKPLFGIDVLAHEFQKEKGYSIYHGESADLLVIKLEKVNECISGAMREFIGAERFMPEATNIGETKATGPLYHEFKQTLVLPNDYIERMYHSRFMRNFYSQTEIDALRAYWLKQGKGKDSVSYEHLSGQDCNNG